VRCRLEATHIYIHLYVHLHADDTMTAFGIQWIPAPGNYGQTNIGIELLIPEKHSETLMKRIFLTFFHLREIFPALDLVYTFIFSITVYAA